MLERQLLTEGHARAVLAVPDHDERRKLARRIVREGMSVRAAERVRTNRRGWLISLRSKGPDHES